MSAFQLLSAQERGGRCGAPIANGSLPGKYLGTLHSCKNKACVLTKQGWRCKIHARGREAKIADILALDKNYPAGVNDLCVCRGSENESCPLHCSKPTPTMISQVVGLMKAVL